MFINTSFHCSLMFYIGFHPVFLCLWKVRGATNPYSPVHWSQCKLQYKLGRAKRVCYLSPMRAAKVQASLRIRTVSPEPSLLAHTSREARGTVRQKTRSLAPLNGWACAVKICHDGMLEDTNSLDGAQLIQYLHYDHYQVRPFGNQHIR